MKNSHKENRPGRGPVRRVDAFPQPPGSSPGVLAGQVRSLPPDLSAWGAPGLPRRRPSGGNGNTPLGGFLSIRPPQPDPKAPKAPGEGSPSSVPVHPRPVSRSSWLRPSLRCHRAEPRRHCWVAVRRRWRRAPRLRAGKWGRVSEPAWGEARGAPACGAGGGAASAGPALGRASDAALSPPFKSRLESRAASAQPRGGESGEGSRGGEQASHWLLKK